MTSNLVERRTALLATLTLLAMTACWGSTFYLIHDLLDRVPAVDFLAVRFTLAAVAMLLVAPRAIARLDPRVRRHAVVLGGLYGVAVGGLFAGESMFHHVRDASKVALVGLVELLTDGHAADRLVDVQWSTPHLASLGVEEIPRAAYLDPLATRL